MLFPADPGSAEPPNPLCIRPLILECVVATMGCKQRDDAPEHDSETDDVVYQLVVHVRKVQL